MIQRGQFLLLQCCIAVLFCMVLDNNLPAQEKEKVQAGYLNVEGGRIYYETTGQGEPFIMIHDGLLHRETWDEQFKAFADNYRLIRYDRRGYGRSDMPEVRYSDLQDLHEIFKALNVDKAIVMGCSAGGGLAIDFTLEYPEKVTSLILVGAVVGGFGYTSHFLTRGGRFSIQDMKDMDSFIAYFMGKDPYSILPENTAAREKAKKLTRANPNNIIRKKHQFLVRPQKQALKHLSEITVPTLIVVGEGDIPDVHAHAGAIQAGIQGAERVIIPKAGHLVHMEQPDAFNKEVINFLTGSKFFQILRKGGPEKAALYFKEWQKKSPEEIPFTEDKINREGYQYLQSGKIEEAIQIFQLYVEAYPRSWNAYDSLGEAYLTNDDKYKAIKNYEKSLELNPDNTNARDVLQKLKADASEDK